MLYAHPKIADVAVLGIPDDDRGEMVVAFVVPADAADAAEPQADIVRPLQARPG